jgi:EpsI family protein
LGQINNIKIVLLVLCLCVTSIFVYRQPESKAAKKQLTLAEALSDIKGWHSKGLFELDRRIVEALDLDDYVNHNFSNGIETVSLYIGYYLTSKKVGAAHSPLVCFQGQGWLLSDSKNKTLRIGEEKISLKKMIATIGNRKELLIYWFQAYDRTSPGTFLQKLNILLSKFRNERVDNAFVRVTVPMQNMSAEEAYNTGIRFIENFYPVFLDYVKNDKTS